MFFRFLREAGVDSGVSLKCFADDIVCCPNELIDGGRVARSRSHEWSWRVLGFLAESRVEKYELCLRSVSPDG